MKVIYYPIDNMMNFRDIALWKTKDGKFIQPYIFLRSDRPNDDSVTLPLFLKEHQIFDVIDLRTDRVVNKYPNPLKNLEFINYHHLPLEEGSTISLKAMPVGELYLRMIEHRETFKAIFDILATAPSGVLVHCTAGKDRTGVVMAILLEMIGVDEETIISDYSLSTPILSITGPIYQKTHPNFWQFVGESNPDYMRYFLKKFHEKYNSAEHYLREIGVSEEHIELIRAKALRHD